MTKTGLALQPIRIMEIGVNTSITVGAGEDLMVVQREIVQPRGEHFSSALFDPIQSSGRKPPLGTQAVRSQQQTPARERNPGPLHFDSPGLSPIPAREDQQQQQQQLPEQSTAPEQAAQSEKGKGGVLAQSAMLGIAEAPGEADYECESDGGGAGGGEDDEQQYRLLSIRALDGEFQKHVSDAINEEGDAGAPQAGGDESLQMMSMLSGADVSDVLDSSQRQRLHVPAQPSTSTLRTSAADPKRVLAQKGSSKFFGAGAVFSIALDSQGSPVIVPLKAVVPDSALGGGGRGGSRVRESSFSFTGVPESGSPSDLDNSSSQLLFSLLQPLRKPSLLSPQLGLGSHYWKERLHRRELRSVLSSPAFRKLL